MRSQLVRILRAGSMAGGLPAVAHVWAARTTSNATRVTYILEKRHQQFPAARRCRLSHTATPAWFVRVMACSTTVSPAASASFSRNRTSRAPARYRTRGCCFRRSAPLDRRFSNGRSAARRPVTRRSKFLTHRSGADHEQHRACRYRSMGPSRRRTVTRPACRCLRRWRAASPSQPDTCFSARVRVLVHTGNLNAFQTECCRAASAISAPRKPGRQFPEVGDHVRANQHGRLQLSRQTFEGGRAI